MAITELEGYYQRDGYGNRDVIRVEILTVTTPGVCEPDDVKVEIPHLPSIRTQSVNLWIDNGSGPVDQGLHHPSRKTKRYLSEKQRMGWDGSLDDAPDFNFELSDLSDVAIDEFGAPLREEFLEDALEVAEGVD